MRFASHLARALEFVLQFALHAIVTKARVLQIRLTEDEKIAFEMASEFAGIPLSSWVRERLRLACIRDLESAGQKVPFVKPIDITTKHD
jgi:hypothetical protein